jgi:hypothetical protein
VLDYEPYTALALSWDSRQTAIKREQSSQPTVLVSGLRSYNPQPGSYYSANTPAVPAFCIQFAPTSAQSGRRLNREDKPTHALFERRRSPQSPTIAPLPPWHTPPPSTGCETAKLCSCEARNSSQIAANIGAIAHTCSTWSIPLTRNHVRERGRLTR